MAVHGVVRQPRVPGDAAHDVLQDEGEGDTALEQEGAVTEEQKSKHIHEILYSCDSREELAERIVALEDEAEKQKIKSEVLKAHGIEIVDAVGGGHEIYDTRQREVDRLEYENAKLRELLKNALTYIEYEGCGVECPDTGSSAILTSCDTCNRYETESCAYVIAQSARELEIEV